jgi:single-stranded DNA-specific DHH superfamily exonuclease
MIALKSTDHGEFRPEKSSQKIVILNAALKDCDGPNTELTGLHRVFERRSAL